MVDHVKSAFDCCRGSSAPQLPCKPTKSGLHSLQGQLPLKVAPSGDAAAGSEIIQPQLGLCCLRLAALGSAAKLLLLLLLLCSASEGKQPNLCCQTAAASAHDILATCSTCHALSEIPDQTMSCFRSAHSSALITARHMGARLSHTAVPILQVATTSKHVNSRCTPSISLSYNY